MEGDGEGAGSAKLRKKRKRKASAAASSDVFVVVTRAELVDAHHEKRQGTSPASDTASSTDVLPKDYAAARQPDLGKKKSEQNAHRHRQNARTEQIDKVVAPSKRGDVGDEDADVAIGFSVNDVENSCPVSRPQVEIIRATKRRKKSRNTCIDIPTLPRGDCGDGVQNPFPESEVPDKYWAQRKRLFSLFEKGIRLDHEGWYSVTPEIIANHIAKRVVNLFPSTDGRTGLVVLDAFCGCGGNAIAFARRPANEISLVVAVDVDPNKLRMAAHNAKIYGVEPNRIVFIQEDALAFMGRYKRGSLISQPSGDDAAQPFPPRLDLIFLSPPWGGIDYGKQGKSGYTLTESLKVCCVHEVANPIFTMEETNMFFKKREQPRGLAEDDTTSSGISLDETTITVNGEDIMKAAVNASSEKSILYFLPRNLNPTALAESAWRSGCSRIEREENFVNGKFKTITVYCHAFEST